ncbi:MAG: cell wall hydrolase [Sphingomonadaceae bacterium]|nr:cell wall hydrolase [Sphingomonadaceae bacterium]
MTSKIRAAAVAAAALAFTSAALVEGGPVQAWQGGISLPTVSYLDHGSAMLAGGELGLNQDGTAAPAGSHALDALVQDNAADETGNAEQNCLANAIYFEARGEPLQGQLAVAEVVMNRAASGRFPSSLCEVVAQRAQFSFVHHGRIPQADRASEAWRRAVGVARVAVEGLAPRLLPTSCLWYHANYVSPSWGHRLAETTRIGLHIFYS